jgi:penicillin-binding protein 2
MEAQELKRRFAPVSVHETPDLDRRFIVFALVATLIVAVLTLRLWYLQLYKGDEYHNLSIHNRIRLRHLMPMRGLIMDRKGRVLVSNRPSFSVYLDMDQAGGASPVAGRLAAILGFSSDEFRTVLRQGKKDVFTNRVLIKSNISWAELSQVETLKYELPGVIIQAEPKRHYVYPGLACHLVGYLGEVSNVELEKKEFTGALVGEYVGKSGIERAKQQFLRGLKGGRHVEVDAAGREIKTLNRVDALPGDNVYLTLDMELQSVVEAELKDKVGAVVALDPRTGEILALASSPGYDQNLFVKGISLQTWKEIRDNPLKPLQNRATQGQYPPGSTFKVVTALAGLAEGVVTPDSVFDCHGAYSLGNRIYHCWKSWGHGRVDLTRAIAESCDVYFYQLGQRLGVDVIARYARKLGFSENTGIVLESERAGLIPTSAWKLRRFRVPWQKGETLSMAIGQSFNLVTPLQVAVAYSALANGGRVMVPAAVRRIETSEAHLIQAFAPKVRKQTGIASEHLQFMVEALRQGVMTPAGTGRKAAVEGLSVAGKTGTVQVVALKDPKKRKDVEETPYKFRDHAWFACFAPSENPQIAIAVLIEHSGHGGSVAAPVAGNVLRAWVGIHNAEEPELMLIPEEGMRPQGSIEEVRLPQTDEKR